MVADLNMPLEIVVCPTVREPNGLAVSSRNKYLSEQQRQEAAKIYKSLTKCKEMHQAGSTDAKEIIQAMRRILNQIDGGKIEYAEIVDTQTLQRVDEIEGKVLVAVAVKLGQARLIDNILL